MRTSAPAGDDTTSMVPRAGVDGPLASTAIAAAASMAAPTSTSTSRERPGCSDLMTASVLRKRPDDEGFGDRLMGLELDDSTGNPAGSGTICGALVAERAAPCGGQGAVGAAGCGLATTPD